MQPKNLLAKLIHKGIPRNADDDDITDAIIHGMIPKDKLVDGAFYQGYCRNSLIAQWDEDAQKFYYNRVKFNSTFVEGINHPEDDDGFDIFVPVSIVEKA